MLFETLLMLLDPVIIFSIFAGVSAGLFVGAMPGLTATMALAVLLPFTFTLPPLHGLVALGAVYMGAIYGGSFAAILVNTPGTPSSIATAFEGYPMSKQGRALEALGLATQLGQKRRGDVQEESVVVDHHDLGAVQTLPTDTLVGHRRALRRLTGARLRRVDPTAAACSEGTARAATRITGQARFPCFMASLRTFLSDCIAHGRRGRPAPPGRRRCRRRPR